MKNKSFLVRFIKGILLILIWPFKKLLQLFLYPFKKLFQLIFSPFKKLAKIFMKYIRMLFFKVVEQTRRSVRMELMAVFGACLLAAVIVFGISNNTLKKTINSPYIDYDNGKRIIASYAENISREIINGKLSVEDKNRIDKIIQSYGVDSSIKVLITDLEGKVLFRSSNASENEIDIYSLIKNFMESNQGNYVYSNGTINKVSDGTSEYVTFYPVDFSDVKTYLIVKGIPQPRILENTISTENSFMALIIAVGAFILLFILITNSKMKYIEEISLGLKEISTGNLSYRVETRGKDELCNLAGNINFMAEEIELMIEKERKAEKTKNELITNVSHDLRTPLTSVMGYLGLIRDKKYENEEQIEEYLQIASAKAEKLKVLIEDLFEYTKLTNEGVGLRIEEVNINELVEQLLEELMPIFDENNIEVNKNITNEKILLNIDGDKIVRVFENILMNAVKYGYKPGEVSVSVYKGDSKAVISISNRGEHIASEDLDKLFDRFYRVDKARTTESGGSGLGLAIAKSIVKLHNGEIWAKCEGNLITFTVELNI